MPQNLVFEAADAQPFVIITDDGPVTISASRLEHPLAIHESYEFEEGEQSVTQTRAGLAFRRQLKSDTADALMDDLIAGLASGDWTLEWQSVTDLLLPQYEDERAALQTLLATYPEDFFGSVAFTVTNEVAADIEVWLCALGSANLAFPTYTDVTDSIGTVTITDIRPGLYHAYAYNPATENWGSAAADTTVVVDEEATVSISIVSSPPHSIPCKV